MTYDELKNLRYIVIKAKRLEERVEKLRASAERCTPILTGMPKGSRGIKNVWDELVDVERKYSERIADIELQKAEAEEWIDGIPDVFVQLCIGYYFVDGNTWRKVANKIGGGNTWNGCRMATLRYLGVYE